MTDTWYTRAFIQCVVNKYSVSQKLVLVVYVKFFGLEGSYTISNFKSAFSFQWLTALVGLDLLFVEVLRSHSDTTFGRAPLDEWSTGRTDLYVTTHNIHRRRTSMQKRDSNPQSRHIMCLYFSNIKENEASGKFC